MSIVRDIHGGIHPPENKQQSNRSPIRMAGIPPELVIPLSQHIGAPATPVVGIGDCVLKGQMIAEARGPVSAPVHASSSGEIIAIEPRLIPHPSGMTAPCIVIKPDGRDQWVEFDPVDDFLRPPKTELLRRIREAGIAGLGGAGFPTAVKLSPTGDKPIETLIINGAECEPYITADDVLMRERAAEIITGIEILRHIVAPTGETLIGVEDNKPEAVDALKHAARDSAIEVVVFPAKYPSGGEKQLIQILTGREVPSGGLPADIGVICQNAGTAFAVKRAIVDGEPLISRIATVTGEACAEQQNFEVLLGTPIRYLLDLCDFDEACCSRLIVGGPMMGFTLESIDVPVVKTTNCILAPTAEELPPPGPVRACIRCGLCAEACPVSLLPQQLYWFARGKEYEKLECYNLADCIECGACSYVCPSAIPLVQYYRASKASIRQQQLDAQKAEQSKARFEARNARIERLEAEKAAKRATRKAAARARVTAAGEDNADAVQAAVARALAKRKAASQMTDEQRLQNAVDAIGRRLEKARSKLDSARSANSDDVEALADTVQTLTQKLDDAREAQRDYLRSRAVSR